MWLVFNIHRRSWRFWTPPNHIFVGEYLHVCWVNSYQIPMMSINLLHQISDFFRGSVPFLAKSNSSCWLSGFDPFLFPTHGTLRIWEIWKKNILWTLRTSIQFRFGSSHRTSQIQELQLFLENSADFFRQLSVRRRLEKSWGVLAV